MRIHGGLVIAALMLGGCSTLDPIPEGVCGNGVLERGEDCDSPDGQQCSACSVVCTLDQTCGADLDARGFVCGLDGLCHAGTGEIGPPVQTIATIETFAVTSLDGDPAFDVLARTPTGVQALYAAGDGSFLPGVTQPSATPTGPTMFADLDGDTRTDVVLPTADGIAAFTSPFDAPTSLPFSAVIDSTLGRPIVGVAADPTLAVFLGESEEALVLAVYDGTSSGLVSVGRVCDAPAARLDPSSISVFVVKPLHVVVGLTLAREDGTFEPCVIDLRAAGASFTQERIALPPALRMNLRPVLIKPPDDPLVAECPLILGQRSDLVAIPMTLTDGGPCRAGTESMVEGPAVPGRLVAAVPLGADELAMVFERHIFIGSFETNGRFKVEVMSAYNSDRDLVGALGVDLDRDGLVDLVTRSGVGTSPLEDLDVLVQVQLLTERGFLRRRYDTLGPVTDINIGDYDGDRWPDVAFVSVLADGDTTSDELAIAYGSPTGLTPQTSMGLYEQVRSLFAIGFRDSVDPLGVVADLGVLFRTCASLAPDGTCAVFSEQVSQLHGSPQRTLTGFFDPRPPGEPYEGPFGAAVVGNFVDLDEVPDTTPDLIAVEYAFVCTSEENEQTNCGAPSLRLWVNDGALQGEVGQIAPFVPAPGFTYQVPGQYVALPRPAPQVDLVIGVNQFGEGITFDPAEPTGMPELWNVLGPEEKPPALKRVERIEVSEGGTLVTKLLVVLGATIDAEASVHVCDLGNPFQPLCRPVPFGDACTDAAVLRRAIPGAPPESRLVALCRQDRVGALLEVDTSMVPFAVTPLSVTDDPAGLQLRAGDVTGDALEDLLVLDRKDGLARIRVYPQCNTRDVACAGGE